MKRALNFLIGTDKMKKNEKGLTLIEILVVMGVFSGLMIIISGIFLVNFRMQRRTLAIQKTMGEVSYAIEYIGRAARMAQIDEEGDCLGEDNWGFTYKTISNPGNGIKFIDYKEECIRFYLDDNGNGEQLIKKGIKENGSWESHDLTSGLLEIETFDIQTNVDAADPDAVEEALYRHQPSITLTMKFKETEAEWWEGSIQTTVARRKLEIERLRDEEND